MTKEKVKLDWSFYAITLLAILTGYFNQYFIFAITILIHELGHLVMAFFFKWELDELKFFAFGGVMKFKGELNKSNVEDLIISSGGILMNFILLIGLLLFQSQERSVIAQKFYSDWIWAQTFVILFNLVPLPPLDGSRLLMDLLSFFIPYKVVLKRIKYFNWALIGVIVFFTFSYDIRQLYLMVSFLGYSTIRFNYQIFYLFQRFLLQKKMYRNVDLPRKTTTIHGGDWEEHLYRGYLNLFQFNHHLHDELTWLKLKFGENDALVIDAQIKTD